MSYLETSVNILFNTELTLLYCNHKENHMKSKNLTFAMLLFIQWWIQVYIHQWINTLLLVCWLNFYHCNTGKKYWFYGLNYFSSVWSFMGFSDNKMTEYSWLVVSIYRLFCVKQQSAPAISNSPGFDFCLSPLCPLAVCVMPPEEGACMRKASFVTLWSCIALTWERLQCDIALFWHQPCSTALLPTQSMEARGPPLLDGC